MKVWHLVTPEFPPLPGGVSEHSRVLAAAAAGRARVVHVWTTPGALPVAGVHVHTTLGAFTPADLSRADTALDRYAAPRDLFVQWVPHGFGYRGMNAHFARWVARRAAKGDRVDVMVHEPFVDYTGGSWIQPARALAQRYMTRTVLRAARRVWMSIPGWEARLLPMLRDGSALRVLPVPGTIPVDRDAASVESVRVRLTVPGQRLVGHFGAGGIYAEDALARTVPALVTGGTDLSFVCLGRGSSEVAARLRRGLPAGVPLHSTGVLELSALSHYLQACDVLVQPYVDGVSGRRTTTISALEHAVPVATTVGVLSERYWESTPAVEVVPAAHPERLAGAVERLLDPMRNALARSSALTLYAARFETLTALEPLFGD